MIHLVFSRQSRQLKVFSSDGSLWKSFEASGAATGPDQSGDRDDPPYGFKYPIEPGHYVLEAPEPVPDDDDARRSQGRWHFPIDDLTDNVVEVLVNAHRAKRVGDKLEIGGALLKTGGLERWGRSEILIHGGGWNLGSRHSQDPHQTLCRTHGCTRMHNDDLETLVMFLRPKMPPLSDGNTVVFSALGDPAPAEC